MAPGARVVTAIGRAVARTGLLGNPSDGYEGRVIACPVRSFMAEVRVIPAQGVTVRANGVPLRFANLHSALAGPWPQQADGLEMLVLAAARRLVRDREFAAPPDGLSLHCTTTIPRQVGLSGSSAAVIATMRALAAHWALDLDPFELAEMALATELEDLGIAAGPMDRVIQSYERTLVLDLSPPRTPASYQALDAELPPLLIAWTPEDGRSSNLTHSDLRRRWLAGDAHVADTMMALAELVTPGVRALQRGDVEAYADLVDRNFELRCSVTDVGEADRRMAKVAREAGAAAKLCGSGGAVLVVPRPGTEPARVARELEGAGFRALIPEV